MDDRVKQLRLEIAATETRLRDLQNELAEATLIDQRVPATTSSNHSTANGSGYEDDDTARSRWPLSDEEFQRYGRTLIMREVGLPGQLRLKTAKALIVGLGGLGCPAAAYLAGAGIGTLGLVDGDVVEISNLHRQIAHNSARVGMKKVESARSFIQSLNPLVTCHTYPEHLSPEKAVDLFEQYDLVLDCTDHPTSRYLISDACVLAGKPLVSASALRTEGQLIVLNNPPRPPGDSFGGPCYRCIFPRPPPADSVLSCGEGGILGPVVGVMGVLQALEAIKVLLQDGAVTPPDKEFQKQNAEAPKPTMLIFSAYSNPQFRSVRMRSRRNGCAICSSQPTITTTSLREGSMDYVAFCGTVAPLEVLSDRDRISAKDLSEVRVQRLEFPLIDVRDETQFGICALEGSVNIPWTGNAEKWIERARAAGLLTSDCTGGHVVCRFGNDSQLAVKTIHESLGSSDGWKDIKGGFRAWQEEVDPHWPRY